MRILVIILTTIWISSCIVMEDQYSSVAPGYWRAVLQLDPNQLALNNATDLAENTPETRFEEVTEGELPFVFELIYDDNDKFHVELINGRERIRLDSIITGRNRATGRDTIRIDMPVYESYIVAEYEGGAMEGRWVATNRGNYSIPFKARHGRKYRFTQLKKRTSNSFKRKMGGHF